MKKNLIRLLILVILLLPFKDTKSKQVNRLYDRLNIAQIEELILTVNHLQKPIS